jgi:hypothetical protein
LELSPALRVFGELLISGASGTGAKDEYLA